MSVEWGRKQERLTAVPFPGVIFPAATLARPLCEGAKKIRLRLFCLGGEYSYSNSTATLSVHSDPQYGQFSVAKP